MDSQIFDIRAELSRAITDIMAKSNLAEEALYSLGVVNFNFGNDSGAAPDILTSGDLGAWLVSLGVKTFVSSVGDGQYVMLLISQNDLRPIRQELADKFLAQTSGMNASLGVSLLGEALSNTDVSIPGASYAEIVSRLAEKMIEIADKRSRVHRSIQAE